jgi:hypothetical protein
MEAHMNARRIAGALCLGIASVLIAPVHGQAPAAAAKATSKPAAKAAVPRTLDGQPDLQGVWSFATVTPMERPSELGGKAVLNEEEAAEFETQAAKRSNRDFNVPTGNVGDYNNFWYDRGTAVIDGRRTSLVVDPPDGRIPSLTSEAQKKQEAMREARKGVGPDEPTPGGFVEDLGPGGLRVRCILGFNSGPPMTPGAYNNQVQIFQSRNHVALVNEMIHDARIVPLDGRPYGNIRQWTGQSRGRWEGDTLVVETRNFRRETMFRNSSANLQLTERFTRVDADTLMYEFTVTDPTTWTRPWTAQIPMSKAEVMYEYACHEGNYGLYNILSGSRAPAAADESKKVSR